MTPLNPTPEREAYDRAMEAAKLGDRVAFGKLWAEYRQIHAQRPQEIVARMEREKGLA